MESYYPTIENTFSRVIKCNGQDFATEIVDTAGQVRIIVLQLVCPSNWRLARLGSPGYARPEDDRLTRMQDEYSIMGSKHFIGIHGYMLVYSVASRQSFDTVHVIIDKILNHLVCLRDPPVYLLKQ